MIVLLRGHIRNSFDTEFLYIFLSELNKVVPIELYIHTWGIKQNSLSWRPLETNTTVIDPGTITTYMRELATCIKDIRIDPDGSLPLIGNTEGKIAKSAAPIIGWKHMWAGKHAMLEQIYKENDPNALILNTRFDLFSNKFLFKPRSLIELVKKSITTPPTGIAFLDSKPFYGCDNYYIGTVATMYKLAHHFHTNLDEILARYATLGNQEFLVMGEAQRLFTPVHRTVLTDLSATPVMSTPSKTIVLLRGHIRTGFDTDQLYIFLRLLNTISPLTIYVHTWDVQQNSLSWRRIEDNPTPITSDKITAYLRDLAPCVKHIRIDPDGSLPIVGNTEGKVVSSLIPIRGWKNMWAGKHTMLEHIYAENDPRALIINTRFDLFSNSNNLNSSALIRFFRDCIAIQPKTIAFLQNVPFNGCDNFYIGTVFAMHKLAQHFYTNLDHICTLYPAIINPERLVMFEAARIADTISTANIKDTETK